jgi:hypothetical protein
LNGGDDEDDDRQTYDTAFRVKIVRKIKNFVRRFLVSSDVVIV